MAAHTAATMVMQASALRRSTDHEEAAVRSLYYGLIEAWNQHNADGMAALFSEDGSVVGFDGSRMDGAHAIGKELRRIFGEHTPPAYVSKIEDVRFLTPDVAIVKAIAGMAPPGHTQLDPQLNAVQTLVAEKLVGEWLIALLQTTPAALHERPDLRDRMTADLEAVRRANSR